MDNSGELLQGPLFRILNNREMLLSRNLGGVVTPQPNYTVITGFGLGMIIEFFSNNNNIPRYHLLTVADVVQSAVSELRRFQSGQRHSMTFDSENERANIAVVTLGNGKVGVIRLRWDGVRQFRVKWFESTSQEEDADALRSIELLRMATECTPLHGDVLMTAP